MVYTEDVSLVERPKQNLVQFLGRCEVMTKWLFYDDSGASSAVGFGQMFDNGFKQYRRNCQVMRRAFRIPELFAQRREGCRILVIAVDVAQQGDQLFESRGIE